VELMLSEQNKYLETQYILQLGNTISIQVRTIASKFHQNPTIPSEDMQKTFSQSDTMKVH
jgi:hypothetical protein